MDGTEQNQDSLPEKGQASGTENQETSEEPTFTIEQINEMVEKRVSDKLATSGRDWQTITNENESLKSNLESLKAEIEALQGEIKELSAENTDVIDITKHRAELRNKERKLREDEAKLEKSWLEKVEKVQAAEKKERDLLILKVASKKELNLDYFVKLLGEDPSEQRINEVAEILAAAKPKKEIKPDSLKTTGSSGKSSEQSLKERYPSMH